MTEYGNDISLEVCNDDDCFSSFDELSINDGPTKVHIKKLRDCNFDQDVTNWIEDEISNVTRRIHRYSNETLAAYAIKGHEACKKTYNIDIILMKTGAVGKKKKVLDLVSTTSTKNSPVSDASVSLSMIIRKPEELIEMVIMKYFDKQGIKITFPLKTIVDDISHFTRIFCEFNPVLLNFGPRSCACAFVFFYMSKFSSDQTKTSTKKKAMVKKTHFKSMKFGQDGISEGVNPKDFDECCMSINEIYTEYEITATPEDLKQLIMFNCTEQLNIRVPIKEIVDECI